MANDFRNNLDKVTSMLRSAEDTDVNTIKSGRVKGKFASKEQISNAALRQFNRLSADQAKLRKQVQSVTSSFAKQQRAIVGVVKSIKQVHQAQSKSSAAALKANAKVIKQYAGIAKAQSKMLRQQGGRSGGGGRGGSGGGIGLNVPTFLSAAAIIAATKAMSDYVQTLGRARGMVTALYGRDVNQSLGLHEPQRDFLNKMGAESPQTRLLDTPELKSILNLREKLRTQLGTDQADALTQQIVGSMDNLQHLKRFADEAGVSVEKALAHFSNFNPASFDTALNAIQQDMDNVNKTANVLEEAWIKIKARVEDFAVAFLGTYGNDVNAAIDSIAQTASNLITRFSDWFKGMEGEWGWLIDTIHVANTLLNEVGKGLHAIFTDKFGREGKQMIEVSIRNQAIDALNEKIKQRSDAGQDYSALVKERNRLMDANSDVAGSWSKDNKQTQVNRKSLSEWTRQAEGARKAQEDLNRAKGGTKTPPAAKQVNPALQAEAARTAAKQAVDLQDAVAQVEKSRLNAITSNPLGFGQSMEQTVRTADALASKERALVDQLNEYRKLQNPTNQQRIEALNIESQINDTIAERNQLLANQGRAYLDAVTAQAFGAGKFSKLIIDQDQNLGMALSKGMAKVNPLLGSTDRDSGVKPFQYGTNMRENIAAAMKYSNQMGAYMKSFNMPDVQMPKLPEPLQGIGSDKILNPATFSPIPQVAGGGRVEPISVQNRPNFSAQLVETRNAIVKGFDALIVHAGDMEDNKAPRRNATIPNVV